MKRPLIVGVIIGIQLVLMLSVMTATVSDSTAPALAAQAGDFRELMLKRPVQTATFQHKVCRIFHKENRAAAPYVIQFIHYYYETAGSASDLQAAGSYLQHEYVIYANYGKSLSRIAAPLGLRQLWHQYNSQERQVIKYGFKGAASLTAANRPEYERYSAKNETWQQRRNSSFSRTGLFCG